MPQTLTDSWYDKLGENAEEVHGNLLDTIGNVTLIWHPRELGDMTFEGKKDVDMGQTGMQISRTEITNRLRWNGESINDRAKWLTSFIATRVLTIPDELNKAAATATTRATRISLAGLGLVGKTIEFIDEPSYKALVVSDAQVEFEGRRWRLSPLTYELKKRIGIENPSGSYRGAAHWAYEGKRILDM